MKIRIDRVRMAMPEPAYSYDATVPVSEVDRSKHSYFICRGREEFVSFADATRPAELDEMPLGWERYEAWMEHEKRANARALEIAKRLFPELAPAEKWPSLWVVIPSLNESHATRFAEVAQ